MGDKTDATKVLDGVCDLAVGTGHKHKVGGNIEEFADAKDVGGTKVSGNDDKIDLHLGVHAIEHGNIALINLCGRSHVGIKEMDDKHVACLFIVANVLNGLVEDLWIEVLGEKDDLLVLEGHDETLEIRTKVSVKERLFDGVESEFDDKDARKHEHDAKECDRKVDAPIGEDINVIDDVSDETDDDARKADEDAEPVGADGTWDLVAFVLEHHVGKRKERHDGQEADAVDAREGLRVAVDDQKE